MLDHARQGRAEAGARGLVLRPAPQGLHEPEAALGQERVRPALAAGRPQRSQLGEARGGLVAEGDGAAVAAEGGDREPQLERAGEAVPGRGAHRPVADGAELGRHLGAVREGKRVARGQEDLGDVLAAVPRCAGDGRVEGGAEQVDVGARVDARQVAAHHLGRHVRERAHQRAGPLAGVTRGGAHGDPPVDHVDLAEAADHHVVELDVAVDDAAAVREVQGVARGHEDLHVRVEPVARVGEDFAHAGCAASRAMARQETPSMRFITSTGRPSASRPSACTGMMLGCSSAAR